MKAPAPDTDPPGRILIVDDDEGLLRALSRVATRFGHRVESAYDGQVAAVMVEKITYDVVLSDIAMPGMNGIDLLMAVRRVDLDVPVVLMTGTPEVSTAARAVELGALRYLTKPIESELLGEVLAHSIRLGRMARVRRQALQLIGNVHKFVGDRAGLEARFARALETLTMAYQPIVSLSARSVHAYEALVRNGEPTLASPLALFAAAERLGRVHDLGRLIRSAVATAAARTSCKLYVNLHTQDFTDADLFSDTAALSRCAGQIVLEITERESLDEIRDVKSRVNRIRAMGYQIAVDDLGAGYAGLTSVAQLEPEVVKIDMSLVRGIDQEPTKRILVGMMLRVAGEMKIAVIAEGVETGAECRVLTDLGCDLMQGYLFAKPGPPFPAVSWNEPLPAARPAPATSA